MLFRAAGIRVPVWLPPLVAFVISFFSSMVGLSGACLLPPFQMSALGFVTPSVSATNLAYNLVAIPTGVWRYAREQRIDWTLAWTITAGTLPGLLVGWWIRLHWILKRKVRIEDSEETRTRQTLGQYALKGQTHNCCENTEMRGNESPRAAFHFFAARLCGRPY